VQHAPDIDMIVAFDVEYQMGIPSQRPRAQPRQIQLVGVARRTGGSLVAKVDVGLLQRVDKAEGDLAPWLT
jgi:hypothetical protein